MTRPGERRYETATAHVAYAYSRRENVNSQGKYHLVLNDREFVSGRYRRKKGETLCPKRRGFWGLDERPEMTEANCPGCREASSRHGIAVEPPSMEREQER